MKLKLFNSNNNRNEFNIKKSNFSKEFWILVPSSILSIIKKIENNFILSSKENSFELYSGLYTISDFLINQETYKKLINKYPEAYNILRPVFKGRDMKRWFTKKKRYMIIFLSSEKYPIYEWSNIENPIEAEKNFYETYPLIAEYLKPVKEKLKKRASQGKFYWEISNCSFHKTFDQPKIVYPEFSKELKASFDNSKIVNIKNVWSIPTTDLSLLAILNSRLIDWYSRYKSSTSGDSWKEKRILFNKPFMSKLPIPNNRHRNQLSALSREILSNFESKADVVLIESEIDKIVYNLYDLTQKEIQIIEQYYVNK